MLIRIGILSIPAMDDAAVAAVRGCLQTHLAAGIVVQESSAGNQRHWLADHLRRWCDEEELDVILTIGGTMPAPGPGRAEMVPEATLDVIERLLPGLPEEMRAVARAETPLALLDRSVAGIRGRSLLLNLPAGAGPAQFFLEAVVDLIEPLVAHLQEQPSAPRLADLMLLPAVAGDQSAAEPTGSVTPNLPGEPEKLKADEFAAFLQRKKPPAA